MYYQRFITVPFVNTLKSMATESVDRVVKSIGILIKYCSQRNIDNCSLYNDSCDFDSIHPYACVHTNTIQYDYTNRYVCYVQRGQMARYHNVCFTSEHLCMTRQRLRSRPNRVTCIETLLYLPFFSLFLIFFSSGFCEPNRTIIIYDNSVREIISKTCLPVLNENHIKILFIITTHRYNITNKLGLHAFSSVEQSNFQIQLKRKLRSFAGL